MKESDYIGFYSWRDEPCRIFEDDGTAEVCAERYYAGKGFVRVPLADVIWEANKISESAFKALVMQTMNRKIV